MKRTLLTVLTALLFVATCFGQAPKASEVWQKMTNRLQAANRLTFTVRSEKFMANSSKPTVAVVRDMYRQGQKLEPFVYGLNQFQPASTKSPATDVVPTGLIREDTFNGSKTFALELQPRDGEPRVKIWLYVSQKNYLPVGLKKTYEPPSSNGVVGFREAYQISLG